MRRRVRLVKSSYGPEAVMANAVMACSRQRMSRLSRLVKSEHGPENSYGPERSYGPESSYGSEGSLWP